MPMADNLRKVLLQQKNLADEMEKEISKLEGNNLVYENDNLKKEFSKCKDQLDEAINKNSKLSNENKDLKNSLYEHIYNEKIAILNAVNKKIDAYYNVNTEGALNRLKEFETEAKSRIKGMVASLKQSRIDCRDEIYSQLDELNRILDMKITAAKAELEKQSGIYSKSKDAQYEKLHQENVTLQEMKSALKKNNIESLIGLNILNKLGVLLLVIGVIATSQYTYFQLPDILKSIFAFAGGAALLVVGETLNRRKANIFSLGITSGGVAILYTALVFSYFGIKILGMYPAVGLCIIITTLSFILSQRYNSQTIASFALIGGYLPIFSISGNKIFVFCAMGYFIILNILALIIAFNKKWSIAALIGFVLNASATAYIMKIVFNGAIQDSVTPAGIGINDIITIIYIILTFGVYTLIPIISTYFGKIRFKVVDVVLIGANTFISAVMLYIAFYYANLSDYMGLLAIIFTAVYLALGKFIDIKMPHEKNIRALFYLTSFTFTVLIIPFQFGKTWLSLGWLVEGVALVIYGILRREKTFYRFGYIICGLCLAAFIMFDINQVMFGENGLFPYKYTAITLGSIFIMSAYIYKQSLSGDGALALKYCMTINLWIFMMYIINDKLSSALEQIMKNSAINKGYLIAALSIAISFAIAYFSPRFKILSDFAMKSISICIYIISILWLFILNCSYLPVNSPEAPLIISISGSATLVIISLLSVFALYDLLKCLVMEHKLGIEWYPLLVSAYFVIILTQNLISQYHLEFTNASISIIYVITALCWIILGFIKRFAFIRRFGLSLSIMALAKLFLLDLSFLTAWSRIISYFAFGITLIAISFIYQYFSKRLEIKGEVLAGVQKNNI